MMETVVLVLMVVYTSVLSLASAEYLAVYLPYWSRWTNVKPFNCRPCLTFHLSLANTSLLALLVGSVKLLLCGFGIAALLFGIAKYMDYKRVNL